MKLIFENWKRYLKEAAEDTSNTIFLVRSKWGVKNKKWDHVGFLLKNGEMKDMSGHRLENSSPIISTWEELRNDPPFAHLPETSEKAEQKDLYKTIKLEKEVSVPDGIVCRVDDSGNKAENCGSFVKNVLYNNSIDSSFIKKIPGIMV